jgi:nitrate reductase NapA
MKDGKFDKKGDFVPVSWEQAFDEMETVPRLTRRKGRVALGVFGSGSGPSTKATP